MGRCGVLEDKVHFLEGVWRVLGDVGPVTGEGSFGHVHAFYEFAYKDRQGDVELVVVDFAGD